MSATDPITADPTSYGLGRAIAELQAIFAGQWSNGMLPHIRFVGGESGYRPGPLDWAVTPAIAGQDRVATSGITQPPIMALCAYEVFTRLPDPGRYLDEFLDMARGLEDFHGFLLAARDPAGEGLVACVHPWETGTDNSPAFEPLMERVRAYVAENQISLAAYGRADRHYVPAEHRPTDADYVAFFGLIAQFKSCGYDQACVVRTTPFLWQDVMFNTILVVSLDALARLEDALAAELDAIAARYGRTAEDDGSRGDPRPSVRAVVAPRELRPGPGLDADPASTRAAAATERSARLRRQAAANRDARERVAAAIGERLWSEEDGLFYPRDVRAGEQVRVPAVSSFLPLLGGIASPEQAARLIAHLRDPREFATAYPVPSTALNHPAFDPLRYWAGPSWPVPNWLLVRALQALDPLLAEGLRRRTLAMIAETEGDPSPFAGRAGQVIEGNSVDGGATKPSPHQYPHAWLWDSAISALGWTYIGERPQPLPADSQGPQFWEYYHPLTGAPLGSPRMSWTAAVFLDLLARPKPVDTAP